MLVWVALLSPSLGTLNFTLNQPQHIGKHYETLLLYNLVRNPSILPVLSDDPNMAEGNLVSWER